MKRRALNGPTGRFWDDPRTIAKADGATGKENDLRLPMHLYEVRPRKDKRGVDLISDVLPFGRLLCGQPNAASNAVDYAKFYSRSPGAVIRVYDHAAT